MKRRHIIYLLVLSAILSGGWLFYLGRAPVKTPAEETVKNTTKPEQIQAASEMAGITFSTYKNDKLQSRVKIQNIRTAPRKLYIFKVQSINELLLTNVAVEIFQQEREKVELLPFTEMQGEANGAMVMKGEGQITQGHILGFSAVIKNEGQEILRVNSREAIIDFSKRTMTMKNAVLFQPHRHRRIESNKIAWDTEKKEFIISGEYWEVREGRSIKGEAVTADIDLNLQKLIPGKKPVKKEEPPLLPAYN